MDLEKGHLSDNLCRSKKESRDVPKCSEKKKKFGQKDISPSQSQVGSETTLKGVCHARNPQVTTSEAWCVHDNKINRKQEGPRHSTPHDHDTSPLPGGLMSHISNPAHKINCKGGRNVGD